MSSPSVSFRNSRSGAWATSTPPLQNSKPVGQCRSSAKTVMLVGLAVAVGVLEDQELVVHLLLGLPVRVGRPDGDPQPALGVERHLHRLGQLGELLLGGEQVDLQPLADGHLARSPPRRSRKRCSPFGPAPGLLVVDRDERRRVAVVDLEVAALRDRPDPLVAVGGHHVEDFHLALHDDAVGLAVDELQVGPAAVDRVAVDGAVAVEPVEVLVERRPGGASRAPRRRAWRRLAGNRALVDDLGERAGCPRSFRWMPLIVSGCVAPGVELARRVEQVDERRRLLALATSAIAAV